MKNKNKQTKFPVARIKKIMQRDEEVGKVAQATPVVISKALELFLSMIIAEASKVTVERGAKRVEAYHLKHAVETTVVLDFLKEIVQGIPDPSAAAERRGEDGEGGKRKRNRGKRNSTSNGDGAGNDAPAPKRRQRKKSTATENMEFEPAPQTDNASSSVSLPLAWQPQHQETEDEWQDHDYHDDDEEDKIR